jgi:hypothetical protein
MAHEVVSSPAVALAHQVFAGEISARWRRPAW